MLNKYINKYNAVTPSLRALCLVNKRKLSDGYSLVKLFDFLGSVAGRNNTGKITVRHKGGGVKRKYRRIDFHRSIINIPARVYTIEYDPYRSAFISLIYYMNGIFSYVLASKVDSSKNVAIYNYNSRASYYNIGDSNYIAYYSNGTLIHNIELKPGMGGKLARSAGTYSILLSGDSKYTKIKIPSGKILIISSNCKATVGIVSNQWYRYLNLGKAGRSRWLGIRPSVRGVAMNPIDHPHGGGEGKKTGRASPFSVWGKRQKTVH